MKIVVIGGSGLIGSKLVNKLRERSKARKMHLSRPHRLRELYPVTYAAIEAQTKANGQERSADEVSLK